MKETAGAIACIDFNPLAGLGLSAVQLRNPAGEFVAPGVEIFRTPLMASDWSLHEYIAIKANQ